MLYIRKLFNQDLRDGKQIAFPKEPSYLFFAFDYLAKEADRRVSFIFRAEFGQFQDFDGRVITTRLYAAGSESRMDGEVKAFIRDELNAEINDLLIFKNKGSKHAEFEFMLVPQSNTQYYPLLLNLSSGDNHSVFSFDEQHQQEIPLEYPLQQIFYGAPGTGKSHEIKKLTEGKSVIRTTFHPDSDYSTFVGCYKPTMADVDTVVVPVVVKSGISLQPPGTYKEKRITYKFVKQAFLKAYLAAWKKYADNNTNSSSSSSLTIKTSSGLYTITGADSQNVLYTRIINYRLPNGNLVTTWNEIWKNGSFIIPKGGSGRSLEQAVSKWIYDTISPCKKEDFEKGLGEFIQKINETGEVVASKNTQNGQKYVFSPSDDDGVFIVKTISHSSKNTVKNAFENEEDYENADEKTKKLVDKLREFDDDFETAWNRLAEAVEQNETVDTTKDTVPEPDPQFLIIEEINRGNCAQIFGDLFQLLDRSDNNFSEYPIEADTDLQQEIERAFTEPGEYQLDNDIYVEGVVENYTSNYNASLSEDIQHGRILLLPSNLYIWATMNTSDQSLFPIDSAFKRRWEWKYVPIVQGYDQNTGTLLDWDIEVDNKTYKWWKFLQAINKHIGDITKSEDKKLGFFFCKATNSTISAETFVSKVLFYLWNDVYKDYDYSPAFFRDENKRLIEFSEYYEQDSNNNTVPNDKLIQAFIEKVEPSFKTPAADENPD